LPNIISLRKKSVAYFLKAGGTWFPAFAGMTVVVWNDGVVIFSFYPYLL